MTPAEFIATEVETLLTGRDAVLAQLDDLEPVHAMAVIGACATQILSRLTPRQRKHEVQLFVTCLEATLALRQ